MLTFFREKARGLRKWLLQEAKSEIRSAQDLSWITRNISTPIPSTVVSLQPVTINWIINDIIINRRVRILELGAGASTQIIAQCLTQVSDDGVDRRLISVEENRGWVDHVSRVIELDGNQARTSVHYTPRADGPGGFWYNESELNRTLKGFKPDLLIIDGPAIKRIKQTADRSRVFHFFRDRMADDYAIFIDDTVRKAERKLTEEWAKYAGVKPQYYNAYLGFIKKGEGFNSMLN